MFRKPAVWIAFVLASILLVAFSAFFFADAFPLVTVDLEMDRDGALAAARRLAGEHGWGPAGFRQAASFGVEADVQSYVELEGGGKEAFGEMIRGDLYSPYTWKVRLFRPGETTETLVRFTPAGLPFGFRETLPEDQPGASLEAEEARRRAEEAATRDWGVDFGELELVESAQEARPGGRTDHTFTYERRDEKIGEEGRYRLRLTVAGDRFTELTWFVKVPEAFSRRYEEMRSANNFIALGSAFAMLVVYLVGGCGVGLFFLFRRRWVIWKAPVAWGLFVAFMMLLAGLNQWPLSWMGYDTALSTTNFALQFLAIQAATFVGLGLFFIVAFMGAESLTRRAFPHHLQLWKVWTRGVAGSREVLGRTTAGYLLVAFFFAYEVTLYFFSDALGWWSPSDALFDPDSLATYFPWLTAIAVSLQAGFMEECMFRAVPLACAALIGRKLGRPGLWIAGALVVEALVFGAGHASYPNQPAYARLVELILPSIGFGLVYLRFGLLPVIVLHFAFDVTWFALPLFVSRAPGAWVDQAVVVALALVPLLVALGARLRAGRLGGAGEEAYNRAWTPPAPRPAAPETEPLPARAGLGGRVRLAVAAAGALGLVAWLAAASFTSYAPPIEIGRGAAVAAARAALEERGVKLGDDWKTLSGVEAGTGLPHLFVWRRGGEEAFRELLGRYLATPRWQVRFARFEGEVAERAEEYQVWVSGAGEVTRMRHQLPQARGGADLSEEEARALAQAAIEERYALAAAALEEVSATPEKHPARRDWTFVYKDAAAYPLEEGEARIGVEIAGDEVTHVYRFLHLPEDWERDERNRATLVTVVRAGSAGALFLVFLAAVGAAVLRWTRRKFAVGTFLRFAGLLLAVGLVNAVNRWPGAEVNFSTAQPFLLQVLGLGLSLAVGAALVALGLSLTVGFLHGIGELAPPAAPRGLGALWPGLAVGAAVAALASLAGRLGESRAPDWADFGGAGGWSPFVATALAPVTGFVSGSALFLLAFVAVDRLTRRWSRRRGWFAAILVVLGLLLAGTGEVATLPLWLAAGVAEGALLLAGYVFVLRHDLTLVPPAFAVTVILGAVREGVLGAYPGALAGSVVAVALVGLLALWWFRTLRAESSTPPSLRSAATPSPPATAR